MAVLKTIGVESFLSGKAERFFDRVNNKYAACILAPDLDEFDLTDATEGGISKDTLFCAYQYAAQEYRAAAVKFAKAKLDELLGPDQAEPSEPWG